MPTKDERREEAVKHVALMKAFFAADTDASIAATRIYEEGEGRELELPEARFEATATKVTNDDAVSAAFACTGKVAVLDPATFTRPAAGYLNGSFSQEDQLCAESNLYNILEGLQKPYYAKNKDYQRGGLFTDRALFVPGVKFTHNGIARDIDVIAVAAPNRTRALERNRAAEECDADLARRIETIMRIAAANGADSLVLCAFGCGFMGNDAAQVAGLFKAWLDEHPGMFETVVFSVFRGASFDAFEDAFGTEQAPEPVQVVEEEAEEEEDDVFASEEEREAGRWTFG